MTAPKPPTEAEVRALRDTVYGVKSGDANWAASRDYQCTGGHLGWMAPENTKWLKAHTAPLYIDTSLQEVITESARLGVRLEERDGHVVLLGKRGTVPPEFIETLRIFKTELLAWMAKQKPKSV